MSTWPEGGRTGPAAAVVDAVLYAGSAIVAAVVALFADIPLQRDWGRMAALPYALGAIAAALVARRGGGLRGRVVVLTVVIAGAAVIPMTVEIAWRAGTQPGLHAQAETIITEEAAIALVRGQNPYAADYSDGPLAARPVGTRTHFPYLPAMALFGLPRAVVDSPLNDARLWFALGAGAALAVGWRIGRLGHQRSLRVAQLMLVLPPAAALLTAGGGDLVVLALLLAAFTLMDRHPAWAGVAAGVAAATKQTAWVVLPFILIAAAALRPLRSRSKEGPVRPLPGLAAWTVGPAVAIPVALLVPFLVLNPSALAEDVLRFPLGLGSQPTPAAGPTLGSLLMGAFPEQRTAVAAALVGLSLLVAAALLLWHPPVGARGAARRAGLAFLTAMLLLPAGRVAYIVYPLNLLAWGSLVPPHRFTPVTATKDEGREEVPT